MSDTGPYGYDHERDQVRPLIRGLLRVGLVVVTAVGAFGWGVQFGESHEPPEPPLGHQVALECPEDAVVGVLTHGACESFDDVVARELDVSEMLQLDDAVVAAICTHLRWYRHHTIVRFWHNVEDGCQA